MKQFRFRLDDLLRLRERQQDEALTRLGDSERRRIAAEHVLANLQSEQEGLAAAMGGQAGGSALHLSLCRVAAARGDEREAATRLDAASCLRDQDRDALVEAHRSRKVIEILRERQAKAFALTQQKRESRNMDDIGTGIAVKKARAKSDEENGGAQK